MCNQAIFELAYWVSVVFGICGKHCVLACMLLKTVEAFVVYNFTCVFTASIKTKRKH